MNYKELIEHCNITSCFVCEHEEECEQFRELTGFDIPASLYRFLKINLYDEIGKEYNK